MLSSKVDIWRDQVEFIINNLQFIHVKHDDGDKIEILHNSTSLSKIKQGKTFTVDQLIASSSLASYKAKYHGTASDSPHVYFKVHEQIAKNSTVRSRSHTLDGQIQSIWVVEDKPKEPVADLLAAAAHDIRSPINSILGVINLIETMQATGALTPEELVKMIQMIKMSASDAIDFTNDVLEMASIESASFTLKKEQVSLDEFILHYINTHRLTALKKAITINYKVKGPLDDRVRIDRTKITRVFDNLLSNAIKFSHRGSSIDIELCEAKGFLMVKISDHGVGMSDEVLNTVFEKFGKAKRRGLLGEKSHGLGMSIVKQIMELHLGDINIESSEGYGTKVSLTFNRE